MKDIWSKVYKWAMCAMFQSKFWESRIFSSIGAKANTPPFSQRLHPLIAQTKATSIEHTRTSRGRRPDGGLCDPLLSRVARRRPYRCLWASHALTTGGGPCVIRPIVMGPARTRAIRVVSIIRFTLMTICNLPPWEYSRDKPGTRGSKCLWQGQAAPWVPINTPYSAHTRGD
jgi:hypothetical protein